MHYFLTNLIAWQREAALCARQVELTHGLRRSYWMHAARNAALACAALQAKLGLNTECAA